MKIFNNELNVYDAAMQRMKYIFEEFDNVLVAFSTGKDSGVMMELAYVYAKENNMLDKLAIYYQDYEAIFQDCTYYAERVFNNNYKDVKRKYWLCMPIKASCSVTMMQDGWIPWDEDVKDIWVRDYPKSDCLVNIHNYPYEFHKGTKGFDFRIDFSKHFAKEHGKTAVLVGIRTDESLTRLGIITSQHRINMYNKVRYSTKVVNNVYSFYPIYDWKTKDIWTANAKFGFDYNKVYDMYYKAGLTIDQMRIASPFHQSGQENLKLYRVIDPNTWGRMISRVNGVNFTGIYGGTSAMGWRKIKKPDHFTWKEYADFLIKTLPDVTKKKLIYHLNRLQESWKSEGYGRNPRVIKAMIEEGIDIEKTGEISKICTKPDIYEIVKIKSGFPEETNVHTNFRICPSWKAVCITILKNDYSLTYMGCSRTKTDNKMRSEALKKYKNV